MHIGNVVHLKTQMPQSNVTLVRKVEELQSSMNANYF
jgi:hypothetical protein